MTGPRRIRTYHAVADPGAEDLVAQIAAQRDRLATRLAAVRRIAVVASGKGGVGKSAVAANLARDEGRKLAAAGRHLRLVEEPERESPADPEQAAPPSASDEWLDQLYATMADWDQMDGD